MSMATIVVATISAIVVGLVLGMMAAKWFYS